MTAVAFQNGNNPRKVCPRQDRRGSNEIETVAGVGQRLFVTNFSASILSMARRLIAFAERFLFIAPFRLDASPKEKSRVVPRGVKLIGERERKGDAREKQVEEKDVIKC